MENDFKFIERTRLRKERNLMSRKVKISPNFLDTLTIWHPL
jgi:hypothetical protein